VTQGSSLESITLHLVARCASKSANDIQSVVSMHHLSQENSSKRIDSFCDLKIKSIFHKLQTLYNTKKISSKGFS